ncbi:U32 family peptidase [Desulfocurvus sp.]|jgi:putative protease|uniref:peptidase U32 family protein n=1 Tax=Desulfocurvus sp. TaxID=2871698 RepID=UPI0025BF05DB|nr:U32 family peptidase [Desulfocurvus sp.]MCK9241260.1 U32 family peptidase [Desulfocurvus sp.]
MTSNEPEILAPAGDRAAFLAALAAGADAIYLGLKHFSARMQAGNFAVGELADLAALARERDCRVYVAFNSLVKPGDVPAAGRLIARLAETVRPHALIVQDLAMPALARQAGFQGELHLSTLANATHPRPLEAIRRDLGVSRVVLPRELNVDEIRACADACPPGLDLEVFVHGALCYNVSGRCYWSSYMGGKSGLRGRCVQPCRREYEQKTRKERFFSCNDLGLDVLVKPLLGMPRVRAWKIEGRKKGPHYVYYTVAAYRLLRGAIDDPAARKTAQELLEQALGRTRTHYGFLPQRLYHPVEPGGHTGSGLPVATLDQARARKPHIVPRLGLLPGDLLRVGYEDEPWHQTIKINRAVPKGGRLDFAPQGPAPRPGTTIFLVDRREPELARRVGELEKELAARPRTQDAPEAKKAPDFTPAMPRPFARPGGPKAVVIQNVNRHPPKALARGLSSAVWLSPKSQLAGAGRNWWWLPPVIWPDEERTWAELVAQALRAGATRFVLGAPWQACLFPGAGQDAADPAQAARTLRREGGPHLRRPLRGKGSKGPRPPRRRELELWAGPFCNVANALAVQALADMGLAGAFASPELAREDALELPRHSPLPLGFLTYGMWPLGITRIPVGAVKPEKPLKSPKGEICWTRRYGPNNWIYPNWGIDLRTKEGELAGAGYVMFAHLFESVPREVPKATRSSTFNWDLKLL